MNQSRLQAAILAAGAVVTAHGIFVLAGWSAGWSMFVRPQDSFIPMAPSTALAFVALGQAILALALVSAPSEVKKAASAVSLAIAIFALVNLFSPSRVDELLGGNAGQFGRVRLGVISPVTAASLFVAAVAAGLVHFRPRIASPLALLPTVIGFTVVIGYAYGTPLLYRSSTIPVALPTGLSLLVVGCAIIGLAGPDSWPLRPMVGPSTRARMFRAFLPVTALLITALGFIDARFGESLGQDRVLVTGWIAITGLLIVTVIIYRLSRRIGTELDQAAAERLRAERRFRNIFEQTMAGVSTTTRDGRIVLCNTAFARIFGFDTPDQIMQSSIADLYWDVGDRERMLATLNETGQLRNVEMRMRTRDGKPLWLLCNVAPYESETGEPLIESTVVDISERKTLEQQLWQAQKLDALGSLAGGVAHDFNNLLTAIQGYADLMSMDMPPEDARQGDVQEIIKACQRASGLTRQLLTFSRRQPFEPRALKLDERVTDMEKMLLRLLGPQIRLVTTGDEQLHSIWADPNQMEQVVLNLAVNARDAMATGGTLTIETRNVQFDERFSSDQVDIEAGAYVMLAVSDGGMGMDPATLSRIFEPFFTTKEKGKGTGLGLATVYGVVKQSHGHILVYSEPGIGTTFKCYFPVTELVPVNETVPASRLRAGGEETVLVVEDEPAILALVVTALEKVGYRVLPAGDGETAMRLAEDHQGTIDLLLSDGVLSGVRVPELLRRFRNTRTETRILLMSGYSQEAVFQNEIVDPETAFLPKPFTVGQLTSRVREVLDQVA